MEVRWLQVSSATWKAWEEGAQLESEASLADHEPPRLSSCYVAPCHTTVHALLDSAKVDSPEKNYFPNKILHNYVNFNAKVGAGHQT